MKPSIFWILLLGCPIPALVAHLVWMWRLEQYHYLPALLLSVALIFFYRWNRRVCLVQGNFSWVLLAVGFGAMVASLLVGSPWFGALASILFLGAFLSSHRVQSSSLTHGVERSASYIWPLSWLLIPIPLGLDQNLTNALQKYSSQMSSYLLDLKGVPHYLLGNVIETSTRRLFVEEACSGVQSLFTLLFVSMLIVVYFERPPILIPLYAVTSMFWAFLMNTLRILIIVTVGESFSIDLSTGWTHSLLGYFCLAIAVLLLLSSDRLLQVLFFPVNSSNLLHRANPLIKFWNLFLGPSAQVVTNLSPHVISPSITKVISLAVPAIAAIFFVAQIFMALQGRSDESNLEIASQRFSQPPGEIPGDRIFGWSQVAYRQLRGNISLPMGENSDQWDGLVRGVPVTVAMNQPYPVWHDMSICYAGNGWRLNEKRMMSDADWDWAWSLWITPDNTYAYVLYSAFNERGEKVNADGQTFWSRVSMALDKDRERFVANRPRVAMIQTLVESSSILPPDALNALEEVHLSSREYLRELVSKGVAP